MVISVVVFDVNETLSNMAPMRDRFADVGAPEHLAALWFAGVLRDGFALTAAGAQQSFAVLAESGLRSILAGPPPDRPVEDAVAHCWPGSRCWTCTRTLRRGCARCATEGFAWSR